MTVLAKVTGQIGVGARLNSIDPHVRTRLVGFD